MFARIRVPELAALLFKSRWAIRARLAIGFAAVAMRAVAANVFARVRVPELAALFFKSRWGIRARLGIGFAAVAGFAIAANIFAEHEISVIRLTRTVPVAAAPVAAAPIIREIPVIRPPVVVAAVPVIIASPEALIAAIGRYADAVRGRVDVRNESTDKRLSDALMDLDNAAAAYFLQAKTISARNGLQVLRARLAAYRSQGNELLNLADRRPEVLDQLWGRFDSLDARIKATLNHAWKIFGRVITRQSLIDLNSHLDDVRRHRSYLLTSGSYEGDAFDQVIASETAFNDILQQNEVELTRSQGESWVQQMRADMAEIGAFQAALVQLDARRRALLDKFSGASLSLVALARTTRLSSVANTAGATSSRQGALVSAAAADPKRSAAIGTAEHPMAPIEPILSVPASAAPLNLHPTESTSTSVRRGERSAPIAWISAGVLLLLSVISIWTAMSIVGPVRRMRSATRRLANGEVDVRVARGGIQELDDLAMSFNQMATQLAAAQAVARTYQEQLEVKVEQRTRELNHLAEHDPLTQLPNRRQLFIHLNAAIARAAANNSHLGVFFIDLDNFKTINDSMGHAFGDHVLESIAERLRETAGAAGFTARLGGDEFTVVCDGGTNVEDVTKVGWDLVRAFQRPLIIDGRELMISISVGASLYPDHEQSAEALLRAADAALFQAKALGRSRLTMFSPELFEVASAKFSTEQGLRRAMERGEFELVFQPEVNASTLRAEVVEALLRWRLPDGRRASPAEFLTIAEESGLIMDISDWVLRASIEAAAGWHHGGWPEARVAINLSSRRLLDSRFVDRVMDLLREHRLPAHCIEIELTENVLQTGAATIKVLHNLRAHGVAIALDDFGTGYSSLASLEQLPLTRVKLDRTLIASIHTNERAAAIAMAILGLCRNIGLEVTAEGIECPEQLALLAGEPHMNFQGYLIARPASADKLLHVIAELPQHMQSLLLSSAAPRRRATDDALSGAANFRKISVVG